MLWFVFGIIAWLVVIAVIWAFMHGAQKVNRESLNVILTNESRTSSEVSGIN